MSQLASDEEIDQPLSLRRWLRLVLALLVLILLFSSAFPVVSLDQRLGDFYFRMRGAQPVSTAVALVLIDDEALARYGRWPWPRRDLAQLVRAIASFQPKALGIDIRRFPVRLRAASGWIHSRSFPETPRLSGMCKPHLTQTVCAEKSPSWSRALRDRGSLLLSSWLKSPGPN